VINLGDQWIEEIDGKKHMLKAVEGGERWCDGCFFNTGVGNCSWDSPKYCRNGSEYRIKDLGILNKDGCLPSSWGEYPEIIDFGDGSYVEVHCLLRKESEIQKAEYAYGDTRQEVIDNWNRRA